MADLRNTVATNAGNNYKLDNVVLTVWGQEILHTAQPNLLYEQWAQKRTDLTSKPGGTIQILKFSPLSGTDVIAENTAIETTKMATSYLSVSVEEHAYALAFSELLFRESSVDVFQQAAVLLGRHYAKNRDAIVRDVLFAGTNVLYSQAGGAATSRANLTTSSTFNVDLIRDAAEFLATQKAPKIGADYICVLHPHQAKYVRKDSAWVGAQQYATPEMIKLGEIGKIEGVRFFETTHTQYIPATTQDIYSDGADTGNNTAIAANNDTAVYRAAVFGDWAFAIADALPVEMRDGGVVDFGRTHKLASYAIYGSALMETGHSCILETA